MHLFGMEWIVAEQRGLGCDFKVGDDMMVVATFNMNERIFRCEASLLVGLSVARMFVVCVICKSYF